MNKGRILRWGCAAVVVVVVVLAGWAWYVLQEVFSVEDFIQVSCRARQIADGERLALATREDVLALVPRAATAYWSNDGIVRDRWGYEATVDAVQKKGYWYLTFHTPGWDGTDGTTDDIDFEDYHEVGKVSLPVMPAAPAGAQ
jgi:hypothetical protein